MKKTKFILTGLIIAFFAFWVVKTLNNSVSNEISQNNTNIPPDEDYILYENSEEIEFYEPTPTQDNSPDYHKIISDILQNEFAVTDLSISINDENIEVSGTVDKTTLKSYLDKIGMLDFKTKTALALFPQAVYIKFSLATEIQDQQISFIAKKVQIEDFSLNTNFLVYSFKF